MLGKIDAQGQPPIMVDARGLRCPWPILRLASAARRGGDRFDLLADDPATASELAAYASEQGWQVGPIDGGFRVTLTR